MAYYNFKKDLEVAKTTEKEVAEILTKNLGATILSFETTGAYDILACLDGKDTSFEVKEDFICKSTNNVGLEFEYRGKPSGIMKSIADYYIYKIHRKDGVVYVMHSKEQLLDKINNKLYFRIHCGGDKGSNSKFYLFTYSNFVQGGVFLNP